MELKNLSGICLGVPGDDNFNLQLSFSCQFKTGLLWYINQ